jgi:hypothetical protein
MINPLEPTHTLNNVVVDFGYNYIVIVGCMHFEYSADYFNVKYHTFEQTSDSNLTAKVVCTLNSAWAVSLAPCK